MLAHTITATEQDIDDVNAVDMEDGECSSAPFQVGTGVVVVMSKLDDVPDFSETALLEKTAHPLLKHVSLQKKRGSMGTYLNPVEWALLVSAGDAISTF